MLGAGTLEMEGVTAKIVNASILKNIQKRAAYETSHTIITQSSSGFCPPKINGDCFINSISNVASTFTCFEDVSMFGIISNLCQTINDLKNLTNLSTIKNPMLSIAQIFLSRFVSSFTFCNVKTVTTIDDKIPYQSQLDIDVLRVSNDRTHLEGNMMIKDKGVIETKEFITKAPEHTVHQHTETSGYCISFIT